MPEATVSGPARTSADLEFRVASLLSDGAVAVTSAKISEVDGASVSSQPGWASISVGAEQQGDGLSVRVVTITVDPSALIEDGAYSFTVEIVAASGGGEKTLRRTVIVDGLTRDGERHLLYTEMLTGFTSALDLDDPTGSYALFERGPQDSTIDYSEVGGSKNNWEQAVPAAMEEDPIRGMIWTKEIIDGSTWKEEEAAIYKTDLASGQKTKVSPTGVLKGWTIDPTHQHLYFAWYDYSGNAPSGDGIYRINFDGTGQVYLGGDSFVGRDAPFDLAVDLASDTLVGVGFDMPPYKISAFRTSLSNPDDDVAAWVQSFQYGDVKTAGDTRGLTVDFEEGRYFALEGGVDVTERRLSDLSMRQQWRVPGATGQYGIDHSRADREIWFVVGRRLFSAPYSDVSNATKRSAENPHWPVVSEGPPATDSAPEPTITGISDDGSYITVGIRSDNPHFAQPEAYRIYRSTSPGGPYAEVGKVGNPSTTVSWTDTSVETGKRYHYVVTTENGVGTESRYSDEKAHRIDTTEVTVRVRQYDSLNALSDFPLFVDLSEMPDKFWANVASGGADIRVYDSDWTALPREVVWIDVAAKEGGLYLKGDLTVGGRDDFYVEVGSGDPAPATTDPLGRNAVWTNGFHRVYHFASDPSSGTVVDSTGNADATVNGGMTSGDRQLGSGWTGSRWDFDGTDDYVRIPVGIAWGGGASWTMEAIFDPDTEPSSGAHYDLLRADAEDDTPLRIAEDTDVETTDGSTTISEPANSVIAHAAAAYDQGTGETELFTNGGGQTTGTLTWDAGGDIDVFDQEGAGEFGDGKIEEIRISDKRRTSSWEAARHDNLRNQQGFGDGPFYEVLS